MARYRVYLKTFDNFGRYQSSFREITDSVKKLGDITLDTDSSDYQIGVFRNSNLSIVLNNREGFFSDVGQPTSIFKYKRGASIVKVNYDIANYKPLAGSAITGSSFLSKEVTVFEGLLNDDAATEDAKTEELTFTLLGYESVFSEELVPFSLLSDGMLVSDAIYAILNQANITKYLTVDLANILPDLDQQIDLVASFENKSVDAALTDLLNSSNSVLTIVANTIYVKSRAPSVAVQKTFYGQASNLGIENIESIKNITSGMGRLFNFVSWKDTTLAFAINPSRRKHGTKIKEVSFDFFTDTVKRLNILESIATEFGNKKQEFDLTTPLDYSTLELNLLDRVAIDYPTVLIPWENFDLPVCGQAICGDSQTATLPRGLWNLTINVSKNFKIISKKISVSKFLITFKLREI